MAFYCRRCFSINPVVRIRDRAASQTRDVPVPSGWTLFRPVLFTRDSRFVFFDGDGPNGFSVLRWQQGASHVANLTPGLNADPTSITSDGAIVAFVSDSAGIVPGDTNRSTDLFRKVIATGEVRRLDLGSSGNQIQHGVSPTPFQAFMSANGHWAAWPSKGTDIVANDTNTVSDTFERGPIP